MPAKKLSVDYELHRTVLEGETFDGALSGGLGDIKRILGADGPDRSHYSKLAHFRDVSLKFKEADKIMEAAGIPATGLPTEASVKKAACLKFARHLYLVGA